MNIALVVLDTLRADTFDKWFQWLPGRRYVRAYSTGNWTVPAHASLFTGHYPGEVGVHAKHTTLDCPEPTLAERLSEVGYTTRAFSANVNVSQPFDFDRGFDSFEGSWRLRGLSSEVFDWQSFIARHRDEGPRRYFNALYACLTGDCATLPSLYRGLELKLRAHGLTPDPPDDGVMEAITLVRETTFRDDEFFFCNLMEAHAPYAPPEEYRTVDADVEEVTTFNGLEATIVGTPPTGVDNETLRQAYEDAVAYLSEQYRELFAELRKDFDLVITLGDHGECFGERGLYQHAFGLAPEITQVPLVLSGEGFEGERRAPVSLLDVHATILDAAGVGSDSRGCSLLSHEQPDREPVAEYHGTTVQNARKAEQEGLDAGPYDRTLFAVATEDGYGYQGMDGLAALGEASRESLRERIETHCDDIEQRDIDAVTDAVPASVREQLEDLGYA